MKTRKALRILVVCMMVMGATAVHAGTEAFDTAMIPVLKAYLKIQDTLAEDKTEGIKQGAEKIGKLADALDPQTVTGEHASHYQHVPKKIQTAASKLAGAEDIEAIREAFKALSRPMAMWATMSKPKDIYVVYCPMAKASWLQKGKAIKNPYEGHKMPKCGQIVSGGQSN